jgi:nitrogen-specific signal transduction histidine kinase
MATHGVPLLTASPALAFRDRMLQLAERLESAGTTGAAELRQAVAAWWLEQQDWERTLGARLEMHHEINNALVGVRGHAQLLLHGSAASEPKVRDRLEVIIRESGRIEKAAQQIREVRNSLPGSDPPSSHAA